MSERGQAKKKKKKNDQLTKQKQRETEVDKRHGRYRVCKLVARGNMHPLIC